MKYASAVFVLAVALAGCGSAQNPYRFAAPGDKGTVADTIAHTLESSGYAIANVDKQGGVVTSAWTPYGTAQSDGTTLVRRFTVTVASGGPQNIVDVRLDVQSCPASAIHDGKVDSAVKCTAVDGIQPADQKDIDAVGQELRAVFEQPAS
jgi:hypothetical protein